MTCSRAAHVLLERWFMPSTELCGQREVRAGGGHVEGLESMVQAQVHKKGHTIEMFPEHSVSYPKHPRWVLVCPYGQRGSGETHPF